MVTTPYFKVAPTYALSIGLWQDGWVHLAAVIDHHHREVIDYTFAYEVKPRRPRQALMLIWI